MPSISIPYEKLEVEPTLDRGNPIKRSVRTTCIDQLLLDSAKYRKEATAQKEATGLPLLFTRHV